MSDYNKFSNYPRSVYRRVATQSSFQILCFLLLWVHVFIHVYSCSHLRVCACVCEIQRLTRNVFPNCSPPFFWDKVSLAELKLVYLGGMTVGSPRNPPALLPGVGIEHVMGWTCHCALLFTRVLWSEFRSLFFTRSDPSLQLLKGIAQAGLQLMIPLPLPRQHLPLSVCPHRLCSAGSAHV